MHLISARSLPTEASPEADTLEALLALVSPEVMAVLRAAAVVLALRQLRHLNGLMLEVLEVKDMDHLSAERFVFMVAVAVAAQAGLVKHLHLASMAVEVKAQTLLLILAAVAVGRHKEFTEQPLALTA